MFNVVIPVSFPRQRNALRLRIMLYTEMKSKALRSRLSLSSGLLLLFELHISEMRPELFIVTKTSTLNNL